MIYLFIILSIAKSSIILPLHKEETFSPENYPFSSRGLSYSSTMTNYKNYQYYLQACIGTPPQCFSMLVSLKSTWILIGQKNCTQCRSGSKKFDSSSSSTFKSENKYLIFDSVDTFEGYTGFDIVNIAGIDAKSQKIILVSKENEKSTLQADGVFGLGFSTSSDDAFSIISTLYNQGSIGHMVFSIYINDFNSFSDLPNYGDSVLIIDGHDISKYAAESTFTYIKAKNSDGYWQLDFDNATFDGINITSGHKAIITPGTSFILGPKDAITKILKQLHDKYSCDDDNNGQLYCNCNENYPDLIIQITGVKFRIKSAGYLVKADNGYCIPTFDYTTIANTWHLGDAFLRRFYTLFDMENMKIGFATVGTTSEISISNSTTGSGSSGNGSGSSGNGSGSGSGSSGNGSGSGSSGNGTDSSGNGSGSSSGGENSNNSTSSSNSDINWKIPVAVVLSVVGLPVSIAWIYLCIRICKTMRENRALNRIQRNRNPEIRGFNQDIRHENNAEQIRIEEEQKRKNDEIIAENKRLEKQKRKNEKKIAEQKRLEQELKIKNENAAGELKRLEEERMHEIEMAEKRKREAESNASSTFYDNDSNFTGESPYLAPQILLECCICGGNFEAKNLRGLPCGHNFCEEELKQNIEGNIKNNYIKKAIRCPYRNCTGKIGSIIIQSLLSNELWKKLNDYAIKNNLSLNNEE